MSRYSEIITKISVSETGYPGSLGIQGCEEKWFVNVSGLSSSVVGRTGIPVQSSRVNFARIQIYTLRQ